MRVLMILIMMGIAIYTEAGCTSTLIIHIHPGIPIKVYIDGMTGRNKPSQAVTVNGLTAGSHQLKVVTVYVDEYGYTKRHTVYNGVIQVHESMYMDAWVEENKGVSIHETRQSCDGEYTSANVINGQQSGSQAPSYNQQDGNGRADQQSSPTQNTYAAAPTGYLPSHISDDDFEQLKNTIANTKYETKKLDTLKVLTAPYQFATSQVSTLMTLFAFESNKFEVAKLLYNQTVDKQNYSRLAGNFNFDTRKEDFKKFMKGK
jgi:hypothetical protein